MTLGRGIGVFVPFPEAESIGLGAYLIGRIHRMPRAIVFSPFGLDPELREGLFAAARRRELANGGARGMRMKWSAAKPRAHATRELKRETRAAGHG